MPKSSLPLLCSLLFAALSANAQINANKGSLSGNVSGASGKPVSSARVLVTNSSTGSQRETRTDARGSYHLAAVDAGTYDLSVQSGSLEVGVRAIQVAVGADVVVDVHAGLAEAEDRTEARASSVSVTDANATQIFRRDVIRDLPIDGRRFQDFASLAPGVQASPATRNQLSFLGQIGLYANVMVDGGDYNSPFLGGIRGSERAMFSFTIPQSAIQEFQVITTGYAPEYGRSTSGIVNAITRSGGNRTHGDLFYQDRNSHLGLDNPYGQSPIGNQQQFGGGVGGAIRPNRLFWFAAAEGQLASFPRAVHFSALDQVASNVTSDILPAYQYFRSLEKPFQQTNNVGAGLGRLDYQFHDASRLTARFAASHNEGANAISSGSSWLPQTPNALSNNGTEQDAVRSAAAQWTSILPHLVVNDARFTYSGEDRLQKPNSFSAALNAGIIGNTGTGAALPARTRDSRLQFADSANLQLGPHSLTFGADYSFLHVNHQAGMDQYGTFSIAGSDVRAILGLLSQSGGSAGNRLDSPSVTYRRQVGDAGVLTQAHQLAFFTQDEWRVSPSLTLSYGLRWEGQFNPSPQTGNAFLVTNVRDFTFPLGRVDPTRLSSQLKQFAPRAAFAWNVGAAGKTVVRGSTGIFYGQTPLAFYSSALNNFGTSGGDLSLQISANGKGTVYQQFAAAGIDLNQAALGALPTLSPAAVWAAIAGKPNQFSQANVYTTSGANFRNPRSYQFAGSVEHQFAHGLMVSYQINHLSTVHLPRVLDFNVPEPTIQPGDLSLRPFFGLRSGTPRPNSNLGAVNVLTSDARSTYLGHAFRAEYRTKRVDLMAHFTLSYAKSNGEMQWPFAGATYQNPFDLSREWNWSSLDAREQSAGYAVFRAPWGIELTGLFRTRSGLPIDALTGSDLAQLLNSGAADRPLQSPGIPFKRNSFRNLGYKSVDFRALRSFGIRENMNLQLSAEMFNVFNFSNIAFIPAIDYPGNPAFIYGPGTSTTGQVVSAASGFLRQRTALGGWDPATTAQQGTPFQAQLGLRFLF